MKRYMINCWPEQDLHKCQFSSIKFYMEEKQGIGLEFLPACRNSGEVPVCTKLGTKQIGKQKKGEETCKLQIMEGSGSTAIPGNGIPGGIKCDSGV